MTKEELKETGLALIALSEGKEVQWLSNLGWVDHVAGCRPACAWDGLYPYRIKAEKKKRLLKAEELPFAFGTRNRYGVLLQPWFRNAMGEPQISAISQKRIVNIQLMAALGFHLRSRNENARR